MKLYIVATPIGNLEDITYRAVRTLKEVDYILCEDTRVTSKLLEHYEIKKPLISYHQRSKNNKTEQIIEKLKEEKNLALVTDAGTPGISDPGNELVAEVRKVFGAGSIVVEKRYHSAGGGTLDYSAQNNEIVEIIPIPGASAVMTLASVAGVNLQKFVFLGFPPNKKGRQTFFEEVVRNVQKDNYPVFYYDSPYRIIKNLKMLQEMFSGAKVIIGRELTKKFEEIKVGMIEEILEYYSEEGEGLVKGEFVVLVNGK